MKKSELEYGNVVELRNGYKYFTNGNKLLNLKANLSINLDYYNENLLHISNGGLLDVMKVYKDYTLKELLWERKEEKPKPQLTEDEKAILRNLPKEYKWIARDLSGMVYIFIERPEKGQTIWYGCGRPMIPSYHLFQYGCGQPMIPFDHLFQFIQWEDKEPYLIEELLGEEK